MSSNVPAPTTSDQPAHDGWSTKTRLILAGIGIVSFIALYAIAVSLVPRWWANLISSMVAERATFGSLLGVVMGFVFALVPILVFLMGLRLRKSWKGVIGWLVVAVVVAMPNIMTLAVRFGSGAAANAARTKLFQEAPGFTVGTYIGIALGVAVGLWVAWVTYSRRRAKRKAEQLQAQHAEAAAAASEHDVSHDRELDTNQDGSAAASTPREPGDRPGNGHGGVTDGGFADHDLADRTIADAGPADVTD